MVGGDAEIEGGCGGVVDDGGPVLLGQGQDAEDAANAARAPYLTFPGAKLGHGNGFLEAFREAQHVAGWLAADPHGGMSDQAKRQFRLAQRRLVAFLAGCWIEQDPLHGDYAFIGLERIGGVAVYDISNPLAPVFVDYVNNRDLTQPVSLEVEGEDVSNPAAGDLGPEGLLFIKAEDSPNGKPLLVTGNEISGSTTVLEINKAE